MVHYFIDFENVHEAGLKGIKDIKEPSVIHVVGSDKTPKFDFKVLSSAPFFNVLWHFDVADNGKKDSLDILLATNLGYSIRDNSLDSFRIVSCDAGYDSAVSFWRKKGIDIKRINNIKGEKDSVSEVPLHTHIRSMVSDLCTDHQIELITDIVNSYKTLNAISNAISKEIKDNNKSGLIYQNLKAYLKALGKK